MPKDKSKDADDKDLPEVEANDAVTDTATEPQTQPPVDYKAKYIGMQRAYDKQKEKFDKLEEDFLNLQAEFEEGGASKKKLETNMTDIEKKLASKEQELADFKEKMESQELLVERAKLIMKDFGDLAAFEAAGLLPDAKDIEEASEKFTAFREALKGISKEYMKEQVVGSTVSTGGERPPTKLTEAQLFEQMNQLAGSPRGTEDYNKFLALRQQWDEHYQSKAD